MRKYLAIVILFAITVCAKGQTVLVAGYVQGTVPAAGRSMAGCTPQFSFDTPDLNESGIAADNNFIWVGGGAGSGIYKADGTTGTVVQILPSPPNTSSFYLGDLDYYNGYLWHIYEQVGILNQIDPSTGSVIGQIQLPNNSTNAADPNNWGIACEDAFFWNAEYAVVNLQSYFSYIHKISYSGAHLDSFLIPHWILPLKVINGELWGTAFDTPWIYRFDKTNGAILDSIDRCVFPCYGMTQNSMGFWLNGISPLNGNTVHLFSNITAPGESPPDAMAGYTVFPQPATRYLVIHIPALKDQRMHFTLFDQHGACSRIFETHVADGCLKLDLDGMVGGIYGFRIETPAGNLAGRFIKL